MDHKLEYVAEMGDLEGQYANHYRVGHNALEFVIEFGQFYEGNKKPRFHTRIISNPVYAKQLLEILAESIETYESNFRPIRDEDA